MTVDHIAQEQVIPIKKPSLKISLPITGAKNLSDAPNKKNISQELMRPRGIINNDGQN